MRKARTNKKRIERFDIIAEEEVLSVSPVVFLSQCEISPYLVLNILDHTPGVGREMILMRIESDVDDIPPVVDSSFIERNLSFPIRRTVFDDRMMKISKLDTKEIDYSSLLIDSYVRQIVGMDPVSIMNFKLSIPYPQKQKRACMSFKLDPYDELLAKLCGISLESEPDTDDTIEDIICRTLDIHGSKNMNTETDHITFDGDPIEDLELGIFDQFEGGDLMKDGEIAMIIGSTISAKDFLTAYQTFSDEEVMEMYGIESKKELKEIVSSLVKRYKLK